MARKKIDLDLDVESMFTAKDDKALAKYLLDRYTEDFSVENIAEKNTLKQLIFLEVIQNSLQNNMNEYRKERGVIPPNALDIIHKNSTEIKSLKAQLGIRKGDDEKTDAYKALESLKRKFKVWCDANAGSRTLVCPHCGKMTMLRIRTDMWEPKKHPMFKDRILCNKHAFDLYFSGKISKMDIALILDEDAQSTDYVDWVISKAFSGRGSVPENTESPAIATEPSSGVEQSGSSSAS